MENNADQAFLENIVKGIVDNPDDVTIEDIMYHLYVSKKIQSGLEDVKEEKRAGLCKTNLEGADLSGATLLSANLPGANLRDADLTGADFTGSNLIQADLTGATVDKTILDNTLQEGVKGL